MNVADARHGGAASAHARPPAVAGMFYEKDSDRLRADVSALLAAAAAIPRIAPPSVTASRAPPKALVVPHAGYRYSGVVAAAAYRLLDEGAARVRRVVLLGPAHRVAVRGVAVPSVSSFLTPLGAVPLDRETLARLVAEGAAVVDDRAHAEEHALEVQLPFLQLRLADFALVPLLVGMTDVVDVAALIETVWGGDETLILVSTDLSHYLDHVQAAARDGATLARILACRDDILHDEACGATPLNAFLRVAARRGLRARLVDCRNSGDTGGARDRVVGYCAVAFDEAPDETATALGAALLATARHAIASAVGAPAAKPPNLPALEQAGATFVTLTRQGQLRGCIGSLEAQRSLAEDVRHNAAAAALRDPRFLPLTAAELPDLGIEVSLLSPLEPLACASEREAIGMLRPGIDGVVLSCGERRATFLPQVWEELPDPHDFLTALKRKAGLDPAAWPPALRVSRYTVAKFST